MIAVVGGGISGLAVGYFLDRAGEDVAVLESASRPGGVIRSTRCHGQVLDLGPQRLRLTRALRELIDALELAAEVVPAPPLPLYIHVDGRLREVPLDARTALTTDLFSWRDRLRAFAEPFSPGLRPEETAAEFFIRKFGRRTYHRVIAPLYGDLYGSDPADMPARHALAGSLGALRVDGSLLRAMFRAFRAHQAVPTCSFRDGLQTLTDALADALGDRLRLDAPVTGLRAARGGVRIEGEGVDLFARHVVLACPAPAAGEALRPIAPEAGRALRRLHYNPLAVVHLHSDVDLRAMGFQVPLEAGRATRGVSSNHAMFGRDGLYTAFLGGATRPDVPTRPDAEVAAMAAAEFEELTGGCARPLRVHRTRMPAWDESWAALDDLALPDRVTPCANWWGRPGVTGRLTEAARLARSLAEAPDPR